MARPTKEEYEMAANRKAHFVNHIQHLQLLREELLNKLCDIQNDINSYQNEIIEANNIILKYATYEEIEQEVG